MDCPRCGTPRSAEEPTCSCGYAFDAPEETSDAADDTAEPEAAEAEVPGEPKRRKKKRKKKRAPMPPLDSDWAARHSEHRMSVLALLGLYVVTCGIYGGYWFVRRQPFLDSLSTSTKIGTTFPMAVLIGSGLNLIVNMLAALEPSLLMKLQPITQLLGMGVGIAVIVLAFRIRNVLLEYGARVQPGYDVSGLGTFFFGSLYLQHKINELPQQAPITDLVREFE